MKLSELKNTNGANKSRFRVGRGIGSGNGKTSGKGHKGQKARSGYSRKPGFEGGQMPLQRRLPKRGFNNKDFKVCYSLINLEKLNRIPEGTVITPEYLVAEGYIKGYEGKLKVLANGDVTVKNLEIHAHKFSQTAIEKIEKANLKYTILN